MTRKPLGFIAAVALLATAAFSGNVKKTPPAQATAPAVSDTGPVFDVSQLDTTVSPCADLSAFVNARSVAANPIPPDRTRWGAFNELEREESRRQAQPRRAGGPGRRHGPGGLDPPGRIG